MENPVLWLTGMPASGKTTVASACADLLRADGIDCAVLDGDAVRRIMWPDLGYSMDDRRLNLQRIAEMAMRMPCVVIVATISPMASHRDIARRILGGRYREVYVSAPLEACEARDPRGMYAKARLGAIEGFTGVGSAYETPARPDLIIDTVEQTIEQSAAALAGYAALTCASVAK